MTGLTSFVDDLNRAWAEPIGKASDFVFGPWTIGLLFAVGLFLTLRLGFVQFVHFGAALRAFFGIDELKAKGAQDIKVVVGGVIPPQDFDFLRDSGVAAIFPPGTNIVDAATEVLDLLA